jgi:hypothetical protein
MASNDKTRGEPESNFSFGVPELRQANVAQELGVDVAPLKAANEKCGFDPYNSSGSLDRQKNWTKVSKR